MGSPGYNRSVKPQHRDAGTSRWRERLDAALSDAVFVDATLCPHCAAEPGRSAFFGLCPQCGARLEPIGARHFLSETIVRAQGGDVSVPHVVYTAAFYNNFLRTIFGEFKMAQKTYYAPVFQSMLVSYVVAHPVLPRLDWVSYIPQTHRKTVLRGSHPARLLASAVAEATGMPLVSTLSRRPGGVAQKKLNKGERAANVQHRFDLVASDAAMLRARGGVGIVVDDFLTTGNTMAQALVTLERADVYAVGLCLASVDYPTEEEQERG